MKTTVDIPDELYPQIAAASAAHGVSVEQFILMAAQCNIEQSAAAGDAAMKEAEALAWWNSFGKADPKAVAEVQAIVDEEFSRVDPEGWE
ncbi:hypothetical protein Mal64_39160 [Pseudobythopirellula maris]|uniref:Uncharacterized protein n=1 Tax=Pseudobythopirellula maris TaxID=2527991 RepID=A0A5C5ZG28_9BACT|nr:hypothetical protein [Pseudobythopirellula maris]TWT86176.1 hypothetical protein Mal64_39160 [Pseudobythopirellula maris]